MFQGDLKLKDQEIEELRAETERRRLSAEEWALLQTIRHDFCKHYCDMVSGHVSGCIEGRSIMEKLR